MNRDHLERLASAEWRRALEEFVLPYTLGQRSYADLGDDVRSNSLAWACHARRPG